MATLRLPQFNRGGPHPLLEALRVWAWPIAGATVMFYIAIAAAGGIEPSEAEAVTVVACVLAVVWTARAWRHLWSDERRS
jgi:hypothetical protein